MQRDAFQAGPVLLVHDGSSTEHCALSCGMCWALHTGPKGPSLAELLNQALVRRCWRLVVTASVGWWPVTHAGHTAKKGLSGY